MSAESSLPSVDVGRLKDEITSEVTKRLELFNAIIESLPDAMIVVNEEGAITLVNSQTELMFGYHRSELMKQRVEILLPTALRDVHIRHRQGYMREPRVRAMGADLQLRGRRKSGAEFPIEIMLSPIVTTEGTYAIAVVRRKATETLTAEGQMNAG